MTRIRLKDFIYGLLKDKFFPVYHNNYFQSRGKIILFSYNSSGKNSILHFTTVHVKYKQNIKKV